MRFNLLCVASCTLAAVTAQAETKVLFSNLGPDQSIDVGLCWGIGTNTGAKIVNAMRFQPSVSAAFTAAKVALFLDWGPSEFIVDLETDNNGEPGSVLEEINVTGPGVLKHELITASSILHPVLESGTSYWMVIRAPDPDTWAGWSFNLVGDNAGPADMAVNVNGGAGGPWTTIPKLTRSAFEVEGDVDSLYIQRNEVFFFWFFE